MNQGPTQEPFWAEPVESVISRLGSSAQGLSSRVARERRRRVGPNALADRKQSSAPRLLLRQIESPLVLILIFGASVSILLRDWLDATIILVIILASSLLGFLQELRTSKAVEALRRRLALNARVLRDGKASAIPAAAVVPGDVVLLAAGNLVPADGLLLEAKDFLVVEAALTGESFPVEKQPGRVAPDTPVGRRTNAVFLGSSVRSGTARAIVVETGRRTLFGAIAANLRGRQPETEFQRGVRQFGAMLVRVMVLTVLFVLTVNQLLGRPVTDSLLFAVALAVGLSPELLPAIVSVTLSAGARRMAKDGVIVRRLEAIENLGSMNVLCTDKTGTLTEGAIVLDQCADPAGQESAEVAKLAYLNAALETGIENPLDSAIVAMGEERELSNAGVRKIDEIPYDFIRRRLTVVVEEPVDAGVHRIISKGAYDNVVAVCASVARNGEARPLDARARGELDSFFRDRSAAGYRVLAVATARVAAKPRYEHGDETDLTFAGFLLFTDPPKKFAKDTIGALSALGVDIKIVSGDNRYVTAHLAEAVGLKAKAILTGDELKRMSEESLWQVAPRTALFVEVDPQQKERIVRALQRAGHAVGYMGDGINDAPALHAADIGISVDQAVDVARESADVILTERNLDVLRQGVEFGRRTFANTLKYISITTSANFGNMISMALATPVLPFLPLLPKQILLNNFLSDLPSAAISTDSVDAEAVLAPQRWNIKRVRRFMIVFGLISTCFDVLTFTVLLALFQATVDTFHTAWFVVSLLTELAVVLVLRTHLPALRSRPSAPLAWATALVGAVCLALAYLEPVARLFGFVPLPAAMTAVMLAIVAAYIAATEAAKAWFYRRLA